MILDDAKTLATQLMNEFALTGWTFRFDGAKRRFGRCSYWQREISLSGSLVTLNERADVENTIRHEIAHALVGPGAGHGPRWRSQAVACGAKPERCYGSWVLEPAASWVARCVMCEMTTLRVRRRNIACGRCCERHSSGKFDARFLLHWESIAAGGQAANDAGATGGIVGV